MFVNFCFSQEREFTIPEIDSIAKTSKNKIQSSGIIKKIRNLLVDLIVLKFLSKINLFMQITVKTQTIKIMPLVIIMKFIFQTKIQF